jgi:sarcosine oxidase, subunit gamma
MADAVRIAEAGARAVLRLRSWATSPVASELPKLVPPALGEQASLLCLAPGEWWLTSPTLSAAQLSERLRAQLDGRPLARVDLSCAVKALRLEGAAVRELLARGCGLDLDPGHFPAGCATRTRLAGLAVLLHCTDPAPVFELYVGSSYFAWLRAWLEDATVA